MLLFQPPPPTRYDLRFILFGFPIRVSPLFWLIAILLGSSSGDPLQILIWVLVVFVSIVVHELGHALAFRRYGLASQIILHFSGGLTVPESDTVGQSLGKCRTWARIEQIFISRCRTRRRIFIRGVDYRGCPCCWWIDYHNQVVRLYSLARDGIVTIWRPNFRCVCDSAALGEHLLGIDQSYACLSPRWRQCRPIYIAAGRPGKWRTQITLGFSDHRWADRIGGLFPAAQCVYGTSVWVPGIPELSIVTDVVFDVIPDL